MIEGTEGCLSAAFGASGVRVLLADLLPFENIPSCLEKVHRVNGFAVYENLVVQMRPGAAPGVAHRADQVPVAHHVAFLDGYGPQMAVTRVDAEAVVDLHHPAVAALVAGVDDASRCTGEDGRAELGRKIEPFVLCRPARYGILPHAELAGDPV